MKSPFPTGISSGQRVRFVIHGLITPETGAETSSFKVFTYTAETNGFKIDKRETGLVM